MSVAARASEFRVLAPTAILGYGFPASSFLRGMRRRPHLIGVDAGSTDPGPYYLGAGTSFTNRAAVKRDLRFMLVHGVRSGIPVVIGSAGGAGARPHVRWCRGIIEEIAAEENLAFTLGVVYADMPRKVVAAAMRRGAVTPLPCVPPLTEAALDASARIVAQMGVEPLCAALEAGCQVILCGRCYDPAVFAAPAIRAGFDRGLALHMGKILECAAIAATPGSGADCVLGVLRRDSFVLESLNPRRRFTRASTAAHTLYEKSDPDHLPGPGGVLNLEDCAFRELSGGRVEVRGSRFEPAPDYRVKLEGARKIGYRTISIAGVRDPVMIGAIDEILDGVRAQVEAILGADKIAGRVTFHVYGRDGVMGAREPRRRRPAHELGIVIDAVAPTAADSEAICGVTRSTLLHYGYPGRIATAGNLAFPFSPSDAKMGAAYEFSVYHLMPVEDQRIFRREIRAIGGRRGGRP